MPMPCYISITGENQGKIDGSSQVAGQEDKILVQAVEHVIDIPKCPQTGAPVGKRVHQGMTITKHIDKSSPKLLQALNSGERLETKLEFFRISKKGTEEVYYTIVLEGATLVKNRTWVPNVLDPEFAQMGHMEDLEFTYEKVIWTWVPDGIESQDDWLTPKA